MGEGTWLGGGDFDDDALFVGVAEWVFVEVEVFFGEGVDVGVGAFVHKFDDAPANGYLLVWVVGVYDGYRDTEKK